MRAGSRSLSAYAEEHGHSKYDWYFPFFDDALRDHDVRRLLEIGCSARSLMTWYDCFPEAEIWGLDADDHGPSGQDDHHKLAAEIDRITFIQGDQANHIVLNALPPYDVIVDDGGHHSYQQIASFEALFPRMTPGGWYFIEDLHCSYVASYQDDGPTTIGFLKPFFDEVNARYMQREQRWPIAEVRFADSIVAVKRQ